MSQQQTVSLPNTQKIDFTSKVNNRRYSISVALPFAPPPEEGYPVLYVCDGFVYFASAVEMVRTNGNAPQVAVVGLGYPEDEDFVNWMFAQWNPLPKRDGFEPLYLHAQGLGRTYDLSLPISGEEAAAMMPGGTAENHGGLDDFLRTIETEVKPRVAAITKVDASNQAFFGHSLGGLAVLHALFTEPNAFRTFIAASPSIWWNDRAVLANEASFAAKVKSGVATPRVLITMGSEESDPISPELAAKFDPDGDAEKINAHLQEARMVENARELTERLRALRGSSPFEVEEYAVFDKQHHGISVWPGLARAITFAFGR